MNKLRNHINFYTVGTRSHPENQFINLFKCKVNLRAAATAGYLDQSAVCFVGVAVDLRGRFGSFMVFVSFLRFVTS